MATEKKVISDESILREQPAPMTTIEKSWKAAFEAFKNAERVEILIPDAYRGAFGDPLQFSVNGVSIQIPLGKKIQVPKPFADHAQRMMRGAVLSKSQKPLSPEELYED